MTELASSSELANKASKPFPNESAEYRKARIALLAEEIASLDGRLSVSLSCAVSFRPVDK